MNGAEQGARSNAPARLLSCALLALGVVVVVLVTSESLDRSADAALEIATARVDGPLARGDSPVLQRTIDRLLARDSLGFRQLTVYAADGRALATAGTPPAHDWPWQSWVSRSGRQTLQVAGAARGRLEYWIAPGIVPGSSDGLALKSLYWAGWVGVVLSAILWWLLARAARRIGAAAIERALRPDRDRLSLTSNPAAPKNAGPQNLASDAQPDSAKPSASVMLAALAQSGYAVMAVDGAARVRWLNEVAQALTGWSESDARGQMAYTVFHLQDEAGESVPQPVEMVLANRGVGLQRFSGWLSGRGGKRRAVEGSVVASAEAGSATHALMWFEAADERHKARMSLRHRAQVAEAVVDELAESVLVTDDTGKVERANARALRMFGYTREEIIQQTVPRLMPVPFMNAPDVRFTEYRATPSRRLPRAVAWRKDATHFPAELVVEPLPDTGGEVGYVVIVRDVSERLRSINLAQRLGRLMDGAMEEVYVFDANSLYFLEVNRGAQRNLGYDTDALLSMTPLMISEGLTPETLLGYLARLRGGEVEHLVYRTRHRRADGSVYPVEVRLNFSRDEEPPVFMAMAADITDRETQEQELSRLAHYDSLTGLPNRPQLALRMQAAMALARGGPKQLAVMFMDVDRFKAINDEHGHDVGDEVLKTFAMRLREALRTADTVARFAGDEFVVLAEGVRGPEDVARVANKLLAAIAEPMVIDDLRLEVTTSIGVTLYPDDDGDMDVLLRHADEAMYEAKRAGRGQYRFYHFDKL